MEKGAIVWTPRGSAASRGPCNPVVGFNGTDLLDDWERIPGG